MPYTTPLSDASSGETFNQFSHDWKQKYLPVKNSRLLQHIPKIYVGVKKIWIQRNCLLEMVDCKPYLSLGVEDTAKIGPGNSKIRPCFNGFQVTCLFGKRGGRKTIRSLITSWEYGDDETRIYQLNAVDYGIKKLFITKRAGGPYDYVGRAADQLCKLDWAITNAVPAALVIL